MRPCKRQAAAVIDLTGSDSDEDNIQVASRKKQKHTRGLCSKRAIHPSSDEENRDPSPPASKTPSARPREVFRELSRKEYQQKLKQPKAWVDGVVWRTSFATPKQTPSSIPLQNQDKTKTPVLRAKSVRNDFAKSVDMQPHHAAVKRNLSIASASAPVSIDLPSAHGSPQSNDVPARRSTRDAFSLMMQKSNSNSGHKLRTSSNISTSMPFRKPKPQPKQKALWQRAEDSDFQTDSSSDSEVLSEDNDCSQESSESQQTDDDEPQAKKKRKKEKNVERGTLRVTVASTRAKGNGKVGGQGGKKAKNMINLRGAQHGQGTGLLSSLPPLSDTREIFEDIISKALTMGLSEALDNLPGPLRVATMCSGTESPLLALELFQQCLGSSNLEVEHLFSAEIVAFKQAYIERNFHPPVIFRDITELTSAVNDVNPKATTAYGSKVPVPKDVDLLIAGTSCVDYSILNTHQKTIDQGGESGDTYAAVLAYCKAFRPAIVILENVLGAPWDTMLQDYTEIGYETGGALVDTKRYYLPQTRQRGYMVCFDKHGTKTSLAGAGKRWTDLVAGFRRPASSPASSFLLPLSQSATYRHNKDDEQQRAREVDWTRCELRHTKTRHSLRLGNERPVTHWSESGSLLVPEGSDPAWYARMVERVWDLLDISVLRKALPSQGFYDARFKCRIWDISQNVDFQKDTGAFGIIGCITPTMMPFLSDAGRVMTPEELLQLQGLPLDKISFTTEAPAQIQDLAGNAMSTTVVGPAILAALIAGHRAIHRTKKVANINVTSMTNKLQAPMVTGKMESVANSCNCAPADVDVERLLRKAARAARRCVCEAAGKISTRPIQECARCGHTACLACAGNPKHEYRQNAMPGNERLAPNDFEMFLHNTMPLCLTFSFQDAWDDLAIEAYYKDAVNGLSQRFNFQSIRQSNCWTVTYVGNRGGRLDLVLNGGRAEWRLFADIPKTLACNSPRRAELEKPVAIGEVKKDFFGDEWKVRVPDSRRIGLSIESTGTNASWWARNGMLDFAGHTVPEVLDIHVDAGNHDLSMLNGKYQYLPRCGTASDGLFKRTESTESGGTLEPLFLFLDPSRTGDPNLDSFVFSHNIERIDYDEQRMTIAHIAAPWRPWDHPDRKPTKPTLLMNDSFKVRPQCQLTATDTRLEILRLKAVDTILGQADCTRTVQLLRASTPSSSTICGDLTSAAAQSQFLSRQNWILEAMGRCFPSDEWRLLPTLPRQCESCAPSRPEVRWAIQKLKSKEEVCPYEDVPSAAAYEQAIKARPAPITVTATSSAENDIEINLGVNVATLAHRAGARLPSNAVDVRFSWRITHRANNIPFVFKKFHLTSNENEDSQEFEGNTGLLVDLFYQQQQSLAWMIRQEQGICFAIEDTEEEFLPKIGWLAQAKASGNVTVRGGICADHPGFGKTILSLALISAQWTSAGQIVERLESRKPEGLYATAATLIVCPGSLVQQWVDEIKDKTGSLDGVISIMGPAQLAKYTIANFRAAKVIVANRDMLAHPAYLDRLASFAGIPGPITTGGRPLVEWRAYAARQIPEHLVMLDRSGLTELRAHIKSKYTANMSSDHFVTAVPSRRHRGQAYVENKQKKLTAAQKTKTAAPSAIDTSTIDQPLLEMFYFNRLVVDEFHDYGPNIYAATAALKADKRWGLSGTPAIEDFYQVSQMAKLLQVDLPVGSMDPAVMKSSSRQAIQKEMSNFEQFDIMRRKLPSASKYRSIHALHQRFLSVFARQNIGDFGKMPYQEHLVPVTLDLEQQLLYTELSQHLNSLQMRIKRSGKSKPTDRTKRLQEAVSTSTSAEEALSKAATFVDQTRPLEHVSILEDLIHSCNANIESLRRQIEKTGSDASMKEAEKFIEWTVQMLHYEGLEDRALIKELEGLLPPISTAPGGAKSSQKKDENESNEATHQLTSLCKRLLIERRSSRYLKAGRDLQGNAISGRHINMCEDGRCNSQYPSNYALSAVCGHLVCEDCHDRSKQEASTRCPAEGCLHPVQPHHLLWTSKMGKLKSTAPSPYGMKLEAAMQLLRKIERKGEQAILFVQFPKQLEQAATALDHYKIRGTVVRNANEAGAQLKAFRSESEDKKTVIVLNVADETAAGSNLQNANHVIFLSPLLSQTQYKYDSTMAQALGRVRRFGQTREIHVYRVVALDTIDVDILEHREHRNNALVEEGQPAIKPPAVADELETRPKMKRTQLVREDGHFSLRPQSWLVKSGTDLNAAEREMVQGKSRVLGWEDFSSLVKFSSKYTEDDE